MHTAEAKLFHFFMLLVFLHITLGSLLCVIIDTMRSFQKEGMNYLITIKLVNCKLELELELVNSEFSQLLGEYPPFSSFYCSIVCI